jgi:hypothetical protein
MEKLKETNLYLRILKFWESHPKWFSYKDLVNSTKPSNWEDIIIKRNMYNAILNRRPSSKIAHETIFLEVKIDTVPEDQYLPLTPVLSFGKPSEETIINDAINRTIFVLKYDAYFNYIDYLELQKAIENSNEANNHAKNAKILAIISIWIAIITWLFQINISESSFWKFLCNLF